MSQTKKGIILIHLLKITLSALILICMLLPSISLLGSTVEDAEDRLSVFSNVIITAGNDYEKKDFTDKNLTFPDDWKDLNVLSLATVLFDSADTCKARRDYLEKLYDQMQEANIEKIDGKKKDLTRAEVGKLVALFRTATTFCYVAGIAAYVALGWLILTTLMSLIAIFRALLDKNIEQKSIRVPMGPGIFSAILFYAMLMMVQMAVIGAFNSLHLTGGSTWRLQLAITGGIHPILWGLVIYIAYMCVLLLIVRRFGLNLVMAEGKKKFGYTIVPKEVSAQE